MRHVDDDYLEGEQALARAVIHGDADGVHHWMSTLGYLPDPDDFHPERVLEQLQIAGEWYFTTGFRRLDPEYVRNAMEVGSSPRSEHFDYMRKQTLPPQALLIRRMEGLLFGVLGELRAGGDWGRLALEYIADEPPSTEIGEVEAGYLPRRPRTQVDLDDAAGLVGIARLEPRHPPAGPQVLEHTADDALVQRADDRRVLAHDVRVRARHQPVAHAAGDLLPALGLEPHRLERVARPWSTLSSSSSTPRPRASSTPRSTPAASTSASAAGVAGIALASDRAIAQPTCGRSASAIARALSRQRSRGRPGRASDPARARRGRAPASRRSCTRTPFGWSASASASSGGAEPTRRPPSAAPR